MPHDARTNEPGDEMTTATGKGDEMEATRNAAPSLQAEEAELTTIQRAALGMKHLPLDEFFVETDAAMNEATPLPWVWGQHSEPTAEELAAWAATCVGKRDGATMQMAVVDDPETGAESYLQTSMFGNGPRSAANAQFAIAAVNNYPLLRDIIRERDATIATLRKALQTTEDRVHRMEDVIAGCETCSAALDEKGE